MNQTKTIYLWMSSAIFLSVITVAAGWQGPGRGQGVVKISTEDGKEIDLYAESHALIIGISDYNNGWPKLPGVKRDVNEVADALKKHGFQVQIALNPTRDELDRTMRSFINTRGQAPRNRLLIYYAGHGETLKTSDGRDLGYIVPVDAPLPAKGGNAQFKVAAISMNEINNYAQDIESKHVLFLFDSCFSGMLFETMRSAPPAIQAKTALPVRQFITAGAADQQVPDTSIFRQQFVAALNGETDAGRDGYLTGSELGNFLEYTVTNYSNRAQTPRWGRIRNPNLDKGDFVFSLASVRPAALTPVIALPRGVAASALKSTSFTTARVDANGQVTKLAGGPVQSFVKNVNGVDFELVAIPGGRFQMGSPESEEGPRIDEVQHWVQVNDYWMGKYEVTQGQWKAVMGRLPPNMNDLGSEFKGDDLPVVQVSWEEVQTFITKLNQMTGGGYRLPTEAEWEYAARGGTTMPFGFGATITPEVVNYNGNYPYRQAAKGLKRGHPVAVGSLGLGNGFGLYEMHGNVFEWCSDWYDLYPTGEVSNPRGPSKGSYRVNRGGGWVVTAADCRSAFRYGDSPYNHNSYLGFRLVRQ